MRRGIPADDWQNNAGARIIAVVAVAVLGIVAATTAALALTRDTDGGAVAAPGPVPTYGAGGTATPTPTRPLIAIIGDDFTAGTTMNTGPTWPNLLGLEADISTLAVPESGYVVGPASNTFAQRAAAIPVDTDVIVFLGGGDDPVGTAMEPAAAAAIAAARTAAPDARIVVVAPPWTGDPDNISRNMTARRDAVGAAATAAGVEFVDPIADAWFADGTGLVGRDGIHPTDAGHARMAERLRPVLQAAATTP